MNSASCKNKLKNIPNNEKIIKNVIYLCHNRSERINVKN